MFIMVRSRTPLLQLRIVKVPVRILLDVLFLVFRSFLIVFVTAMPYSFIKFQNFVVILALRSTKVAMAVLQFHLVRDLSLTDINKQIRENIYT